MVSLRPATEDDLAQVMRIETHCYPKPWAKEHFQDEMKIPYAKFMVLTDDETDEVIAGYIVYHVQVEGVSLLNVAVHPTWRNQGFARKMLLVMINEAVRDEIPKVMLEVRAGNTSALNLYQQLGFKQTHERKGFYSNGETAIAMEIKTSDLSGIVQ